MEPGKSVSIQQLVRASGYDALESREFAAYVDKLPLSLSHLRGKFAYPTNQSLASSATDSGMRDKKGSSYAPVYFCGNSLGLMPLEVRTIVNEELDIWAGRGVLGHFDHPLKRPWKDITETVEKSMANIVGAQTSEVAIMGSLTSNLHTMMSAFYRPRGKRTKILFEEKAFPSDQYAFASQTRLHGLSPADHLIALGPRSGEYTLRTEDILSTIEKHGDEIALVMFSGVQYYTGQFFDIPTITKKGHEAGAVVGWDLAHAVGNLPLQLHDWNVDFACWCNYKYMNAGPGAIAGIFVHKNTCPPESPDENPTPFEYGNRLAGWWGHNAVTRFRMDPTFDPIPGAAGYQLSNPSVLNVVSLLASLRIFNETSMTALRQKSLLLTEYLEKLLSSPLPESSLAHFKIITPRDPDARGAQLSVLFEPTGQGVMEYVMEELLKHGIIGDERQPDVIRLSPIPSYNSFEDVRVVAETVRGAISQWVPQKQGDDRIMTQTT